jgi:hypothetical protein
MFSCVLKNEFTILTILIVSLTIRIGPTKIINLTNLWHNASLLCSYFWKIDVSHKVFEKEKVRFDFKLWLQGSSGQRINEI